MNVRLVPGACPLCGPLAAREVIAAGIDFEYAVTGDQEFTIARCGCGIRYLDPRPADEEIGKLYPPDYEPYRFNTLPMPVRAGRDLVERRKVNFLAGLAHEGACIVDLGCGGGALLQLLRRRGRPSWRLIGWDFPGAHLDRLRAEGFDVISGPVTAELAPEGTAVFVLNQVIEHFPHPERILGVVAGALARGGHVVIETPDVDGPDARWFGRRYWGGYHFPRHLVLFNSTTLRRLVERAGLRVVRVQWLPSPAFWVQSVHHLLSERRRVAPLARAFTLRNPLAVAAATTFDLVWSRFAPTTNLRLIAKRG